MVARSTCITHGFNNPSDIEKINCPAFKWRGRCMQELHVTRHVHLARRNSGKG